MTAVDKYEHERLTYCNLGLYCGGIDLRENNTFGILVSVILWLNEKRLFILIYEEMLIWAFYFSTESVAVL